MAENSCMDRRTFLRLGGLTLVISSVSPKLVSALGDPRLERLRGAQATGKTLVYIFQRFGCDGLNITIPTDAAEYALYKSYRPTLGIGTSATDPLLTAQQLTPQWCLNPVMKAGLYSLYQQGTMAVFPDMGYPNASRSHFDSQMFVDNGTPYDKTTPDGWLNRFLQEQPNPANSLRALSFGSSLPFSLVGPQPALAFSDLSSLSVSGNGPRNTAYLNLMKKVYAKPTPGRPYDDEMELAGAGLVDAINQITAQTLPAPAPVPPYAYPANSTFATQLSQLAQLIRTDQFAIEVAEVDFGGWDTHSNQQTQSDPVSGYFPDHVREFSDSIAAFVSDLGSTRMANTVILTTSEFGRTSRENGNIGTDHGSGWASFAIGGAVKPGVYHGPGGWKGLANLRDDRDIDYSLDYRDFLLTALQKHMGATTSSIFPGWTYTPQTYL